MDPIVVIRPYEAKITSLMMSPGVGTYLLPKATIKRGMDSRHKSSVYNETDKN